MLGKIILECFSMKQRAWYFDLDRVGCDFSPMANVQNVATNFCRQKRGNSDHLNTISLILLPAFNEIILCQVASSSTSYIYSKDGS